jgi:hypothetical protein
MIGHAQMLQAEHGGDHLPAPDRLIRSRTNAGRTGGRSRQWKAGRSVRRDREQAASSSDANQEMSKQKTTGAPTPIVSPLFAIVAVLSVSPDRCERSVSNKLF